MSSDGRPIYVIDTNVLVDYPDVIPNGHSSHPEAPTVDLEGAHLVIPSAVVRELSSFKKEKSDRGKVARVVLKRLRKLMESNLKSMKDNYDLEAPIEKGGMLISVLPVHKDFKKSLPFSPSDDDMDSQIILAALAVMALQRGFRVDGTMEPFKALGLGGGCVMSNVMLLTNDNGLAIRARERGVRTSRYGYQYPEPYTGRRDIIVPKELFTEFYNSGKVSRKLFEELMPKEQKLVANEFIIMSLEDPEDYPEDFDPTDNPYFLHIGRYDSNEDAIVKLKYVDDFPCRIKNAGQAIYAEAMMNPEIAAIICRGPAGSGKTYMATIYGYDACRRGQFIGVTVVPCESHSKIGALPGDLDEKMDPDVQPLKNALRNYLLSEDKKFAKDLENLRKFGTGKKAASKSGGSSESDDSSGGSEKRSIKEQLKDRVELIWNNWFSSVPIENARGRDFAHELAIYDEFQDQNASQADTLIKRIGLEGKIILAGDIYQIHAPYLDENNNGLVYASRMLYNHPMVAQVCFTEDEVVRHLLVKLVAERQKNGANDPG